MFPGRHGGDDDRGGAAESDDIAGAAKQGGLTAEDSVFGLANFGLSTQRAVHKMWPSL